MFSFFFSFVKHIHSLDCSARDAYLPCLSYSLRGFHITTVGICELSVMKLKDSASVGH